MWVRGYVDRVVIGCAGEVIARHVRSYEREEVVFNPLHYLPLLERKLGALDQAAPLAGWELPEAFHTLRRLLEARAGRGGRREYVQVLRLLETFDLQEVHAAVNHALSLGAIGFDAVKHLVLCRVLVFRLLPMGFANRELRAHVATLLGVSADAYGSTRATYDLRRLRLRGLIEHIPRSHRYRVTEAGQRVALCYSRGQRRILGPALSAVFDDATPPALGQLVKRFDDHINRLWQGQPLAA